MNSPGAHAILWAAWRSSVEQRLWPIFVHWITFLQMPLITVNVTDILLMEAEWWKDEFESE